MERTKNMKVCYRVCQKFVPLKQVETRGWALDRVHNWRRPLDRLQYDNETAMRDPLVARRHNRNETVPRDCLVETLCTLRPCDLDLWPFDLILWVRDIIMDYRCANGLAVLVLLCWQTHNVNHTQIESSITCGWLLYRRRIKVGFHYPSSPPEFTGRELGPWTRVVETGL